MFEVLHIQKLRTNRITKEISLLTAMKSIFYKESLMPQK